MSTKVVRSMKDFIRHGMEVQVTCYCGYSARLNARDVVARFQRNGWSMHVDWSHHRFRCSVCGSTAQYVGPGYR